MFLTHLSLQNFRTHQNSQFDFSPEINLVVGPNTAGKTNLLEAIYLLAHGKSFRAKGDREMINWSKELGRVKGSLGALSLGAGEEVATLEIIVTTGLVQNQKAPFKKYLVNRVSRRQIDFVGNLRAVYFGPEDLQLITDSPSRRRNFLDGVLEQVDRDYRQASLIYQKALRARNKLLVKKREGIKVASEEMEYWDDLLCQNGPQITKKREEFIDFLNQKESAGRKIIYDRSLISLQRLSQYALGEAAVGMTLVGPQRDDFKILISDRDLSIYGSRGEQRLAVLWLKLGELEFIAAKSGERPILLLDDIFSELDHQNRQQVLAIIPRQQTFITTTDLHLIEKDYQNRAEMIELG